MVPLLLLVEQLCSGIAEWGLRDSCMKFDHGMLVL